LNVFDTISAPENAKAIISQADIPGATKGMMGSEVRSDNLSFKNRLE
tara:strand:- start:95 stop:235 length:141 start_codon:yes stop_codon:yes gene_type:complete